nr:hypothetical protein [uncultured Sediminibacterium sp.]
MKRTIDNQESILNQEKNLFLLFGRTRFQKELGIFFLSGISRFLR